MTDEVEEVTSSSPQTDSNDCKDSAHCHFRLDTPNGEAVEVADAASSANDNDADESDAIDDPLESLRALQTGDILLYRTRDIGAQFNSVVGGSFYSHVAMVIRANDPKNKSLLQELYADDYKENNRRNNSGLALLEAEPRRGVAIFPLIPRLARTIKTIRHLAVRKHVGNVSQDMQDSIMNFCQTVRGRKLEVASLDMLRALCFNRFRFWCCKQRGQNTDTFFCSELVAEALLQAGILRDDLGVTSNLLIPSSFQDPISRKHMRHSGAFDVLKDSKICTPGHDFSKAQVLVEPGNPLETALQQTKQRMKEDQRRRRMTKFRASIYQSVRKLGHRPKETKTSSKEEG